MTTNTPLPSDITILDNLLALNLNISLWSARKKLTPQDFGKDDLGTVELPPEDLATLGSKRMAPPESLRIFGTLKARAFNFLDRHGIRFMSGWAIPEDKAAEVIQELMTIRDEFLIAKEQFLSVIGWQNMRIGETSSPIPWSAPTTCARAWLLLGKCTK